MEAIVRTQGKAMKERDRSGALGKCLKHVEYIYIRWKTKEGKGRKVEITMITRIWGKTW